MGALTGGLCETFSAPGNSFGGQYGIVPQNENPHTLRLRTIRCLLADAQLGNDGAVAPDIFFGQIVQQAAALTDHLVHTQTAVLVIGMNLQVGGELTDALGEDSDLDLRRAGVGVMGAVGLDDLGFLCFGDHAVDTSFP